MWFLWGTNWISLSFCSGDVMWFLWGTNWISLSFVMLSTLLQDILHPSHHLLNVLLQIANKLGLSNKTKIPLQRPVNCIAHKEVKDLLNGLFWGSNPNIVRRTVDSRHDFVNFPFIGFLQAFLNEVRHDYGPLLSIWMICCAPIGTYRPTCPIMTRPEAQGPWQQSPRHSER
jgi:hypothetical protein